VRALRRCDTGSSAATSEALTRRLRCGCDDSVATAYPVKAVQATSLSRHFGFRSRALAWQCAAASRSVVRVNKIAVDAEARSHAAFVGATEFMKLLHRHCLEIAVVVVVVTSYDSVSCPSGPERQRCNLRLSSGRQRQRNEHIAQRPMKCLAKNSCPPLAWPRLQFSFKYSIGQELECRSARVKPQFGWNGRRRRAESTSSLCLRCCAGLIFGASCAHGAE